MTSWQEWRPWHLTRMEMTSACKQLTILGKVPNIVMSAFTTLTFSLSGYLTDIWSASFHHQLQCWQAGFQALSRPESPVENPPSTFWGWNMDFYTCRRFCCVPFLLTLDEIDKLTFIQWNPVFSRPLSFYGQNLWHQFNILCWHRSVWKIIFQAKITGTKKFFWETIWDFWIHSYSAKYVN